MTDRVCISDLRIPSVLFTNRLPNDAQWSNLLALGLYSHSISVLHRQPDIIPPRVIDDLARAAELGHDRALDKLVELLVFNTLPNINPKKKLELLEKFALRNKDAAFECALAYIKMGNFQQAVIDVKKAKTFFTSAIALGHSDSFSAFLNAICDGLLNIQRDEFLKICGYLISEYRNTEIALTLGCLYCKLTIRKRPELNNYGLDNPNKGFDCLKFVFENGTTEQSSCALRCIDNGIRRKIFTSPAALQFQVEREIQQSPESASFMLKS